MAIYDCFLFLNELDLLDIRLRELDAVVDHFVLAEAPVTFSGKPKPLYFAEHAERFAHWWDRITHVVVDDMPGGSDPWARERHQRDATVRGLAAAPDDGIIISDCDELPSADAIRRWRGDARMLEQMLSYYWINCVGGTWFGSRLVRFQDLQQHGSASAVRQARLPVLPRGGWHFSYLGGPERIAEKLESYSHTELNHARFKDARHVRMAMAFGTDLFGRPGMRWHFTPVDERFPEAVRAADGPFAHLICDARFHEEWCPHEQLVRLSAAVGDVREVQGAILEIGCWEGRSTIALANSAYPETVIAIDTWLGSANENPEHPTVRLARERDVFGQFQMNVAALTQGNVSPLRCDCHAALAAWHDPIKFVYIDGSHDYQSVRRSIEACVGRLVRHGIICGDDFLNAGLSRTDLGGGVERAVRDLLPGFEQAGNFWLWRRPERLESRGA